MRHGSGQEHGPNAGDVRAGQSVDGAQDDFAGGAGMSAPAGRRQALAERQNGSNGATQRQKSGVFAHHEIWGAAALIR